MLSILTRAYQLRQNDLRRTQALCDVSAYLADLLARYAGYEMHYSDPRIKDWSQLQGCIVDVYTAVLKYAIGVKSAREYDVDVKLGREDDVTRQ